ncbi:MAG: ChpI protein [Treponema sp.]|nr:ChpI protein [Treponema sp.]
MKTAVSLPNLLYEKAEETASYLGIPRSKLYALALEEFIEKHNGKMITEKINAVYEKIDQSEFDHYLNVGLEPIRNLTKNDTW